MKVSTLTEKSNFFETIYVAVSALCYITYVQLFQRGNEELLEG